MAAFGAKYLKVATIKEEANDALPTYEDNAVLLGALVKADLTVNYASGELYADDKLQEKMTEFASGTLAAETDELKDDMAAVIYGSAIDSKNKEKTDNTADQVPGVGIGYYKSLSKNNKKFYRGYYYPKAKAQIGNDSAATKSSSITFSTTPITFTIFEAENGDWRKTKEFETAKEAEAWIDEKLGNTTE